jgi:hypothetical protein
MVFADPRILKQGTKQNANCNTVGTDSPLSDLCDQRSANDASNGVSKTDRNPETTGTLLVSKDCIRLSGGRCFNAFNVQITGNNPQPSSFSVSDTQSQTVILDPGSFTVSEVPVAGFIVSFSGNCAQIVPGSHEATGTISAGQHLTCVIRNVTP